MAVQGKDCSAELQQRIQAAAEARQPLYLGGSGSKSFYVTAANAAERLDLTAHRGIVSYEPTELVLTARAGTPLAELEQVLAEHGQLLPLSRRTSTAIPHWGERSPPASPGRAASPWVRYGIACLGWSASPGAANGCASAAR